MYGIKCTILRSQILIFWFIFKVNHVFMEEKTTLHKKNVIDEEELDGIVIGIWNLENLPRTLFIDYKCWNLKVVVDGRELTRNIKNKKKADVLLAYKCPLCDIRYRRERIFNKHMEYFNSASCYGMRHFHICCVQCVYTTLSFCCLLLVKPRSYMTFFWMCS